MVNYKYIFAVGASVLLPISVAADTCSTLPTCESIGFTYSAGDCGKLKKLKCPFGDAYFCSGTNCKSVSVSSTEKCTKCAYTYSEKEAPFGHSYTCIFERLPAESVPGEQIYQCERCGWMYGKTTMASLAQHDEIPKWIPIVMIAEGAVILLGVVTSIVLICAKRKRANK